MGTKELCFRRLISYSGGKAAHEPTHWKQPSRAVETIFLIFNSQLNREGPSRSNSREHSHPPSYESDLLSLGTEATAPQPLIDDSIEPVMRGEISSNEITPTLY